MAAGADPRLVNAGGEAPAHIVVQVFCSFCFCCIWPFLVDVGGEAPTHIVVHVFGWFFVVF